MATFSAPLNINLALPLLCLKSANTGSTSVARCLLFWIPCSEVSRCLARFFCCCNLVFTLRVLLPVPGLKVASRQWAPHAIFDYIVLVPLDKTSRGFSNAFPIGFHRLSHRTDVDIFLWIVIQVFQQSMDFL